MFCSWWRN